MYFFINTLEKQLRGDDELEYFEKYTTTVTCMYL